MTKGPLVFDLDDTTDEAPRPQDAPPPPDQPQGRAMRRVIQGATSKPSLMARLFWGATAGLVSITATTMAYDWIIATIAARPLLGWLLAGLSAVLIMVLIVGIISELRGWLRLGRVDRVRSRAETALAARDLTLARGVTEELLALTQRRAELVAARTSLRAEMAELLDADTLLERAETTLLVPLDDQARTAIEEAARQVATATALIPLAAADIFAALFANLRMIRRIGEIYGGRGGRLANWRLTRAVLSHLVATGAVAIGDDMLESFAGGGLLAKLSRRFGEGLVNGALTARVGVAAMEVTRPLPFITARRPKASRLMRRALSGFFERSPVETPGLT